MTGWFSRSREVDPGTAVFGPLEWRVLEALWSRDTPASVRDLCPLFSEIAYTTVMTTLDRLHRKGLLDRTKRGRAFFYAPRLSRPQFDSARAAHALRAALETEGSELRPLLSTLVDAVSERDYELLDELEALVRARRAELDGERR